MGVPCSGCFFTFLFLGPSGGWSPDNCLHGLWGSYSRRALMLWEIKVEYGKTQLRIGGWVGLWLWCGDFDMDDLIVIAWG